MPAKDLRPVADTNIFQIGEMHFIKVSDLFKYRSSINSRSGTGGKHLPLPVIALAGSPHAPLISPTQDAVHISCIVHQLLVIHLHHFTADGKDLIRPADGFYHLADEIRLHLGIIIQQQDKRRF